MYFRLNIVGSWNNQSIQVDISTYNWQNVTGSDAFIEIYHLGVPLILTAPAEGFHHYGANFLPVHRISIFDSITFHPFGKVKSINAVGSAKAFRVVNLQNLVFIHPFADQH